MQDQLQQAKAEYARGLAQLKSSAGALQSLGSRVQSSEKAAKGEWGVDCRVYCSLLGGQAAASHPPTPHPLTTVPAALRCTVLGAALVDDLRQLPSQAAVQLRSDAAVVAASAKVQRAALDKALQRVAKDYGI